MTYTQRINDRMREYLAYEYELSSRADEIMRERGEARLTGGARLVAFRNAMAKARRENPRPRPPG